MTLHLNAIIACAGRSSIASCCCRDVSGGSCRATIVGLGLGLCCAVVRQVGPVTLLAGAAAATVTSLLSPGMILGASAALCQFVIGIFDEARL